ncbi:MAG: hypothetical protein QM762_14040 [Chryseolinea sp.]
MRRGTIEPKLQFPVIINTSDGTTTFYTSQEPLVRITKRAFDKRMFEGAILIDSSGSKFKVVRVVNLGFINLFWGLNVFLDSEVYVRLELAKIEELGLEQFRGYAKKIAKSNEDYYLSAGIDINTILRAIDKAPDVSTLTQIVAGT